MSPLMNQVPLPAGSMSGAASAIDAPPSFIENLPLAIYACDAKGRMRWFNKRAAELWGRAPRTQDDAELFCGSHKLYTLDGVPIGRTETPMASVLQSGNPLHGKHVIFERPDGSRVSATLYIDPVKDERARVIGAITCFHEDETQTESDAQAQGLVEAKMRAAMGELQHRVKNNMQMLQSLLGGAEREATNPEARELLANAGRRVGAIAAAQSGLYAGNVEQVDGRALLESLCRHASQTFGAKADIRIEAASGELPKGAAVPLALIVNELITNAVTHARGTRNHVSIKISLVQNDEEGVLSIADDGPGFTFQPPKRRASGLGLVAGLARQLGGNLEVTAAGGARCVVRFGGGRNSER
jgi:two-component sensor histidine kinase